MPKVSVILTSFNHAKYLRDAIDSSLNQTYDDFELIIWDDASTDESWFIINSYKDSRIKAFRNEERKRGVYGINKAIREIARSEYIAIHHSDDVWEPYKLERQVKFLDEHPDIGAVFSNALAIKEDGAALEDSSHFYYNIFEQPNRSRYEWLNHFFYKGNALCHPSVLIRRQCYNDCGLYRPWFAQIGDFDMWIRLCLKHNIYVLPEKLVRFRVRENEANTSGNRPDARIRGMTEFHHVLRNYLLIDTFDEMVSVFPEARKFFRLEGFEHKFVLAMICLGDKSLHWAKLLGLELLFELLSDTEKAKTIKTLYSFDYRNFIELTAIYDVFSLETVANLSQAVTERDEQIAYFNKVIVERNEQITNLNQAMAELNGQIASLNQVVAERDGLRDILNKERDRANALESTIRHQRNEIERITIDKDWEILQLRAQLDSVYRSRSWRLTKPLRAIGYSLRRYGFTKSKIQTKIWRIGAGVYHRLPLDMGVKIRMKNFVYQRFGLLISNTAGYQNWKRFQGEPPVYARVIPHPNYPDPSAREPFCFPVVSQPAVSIIIPVYNKSDYTYACLRSIFENQPKVEFEIIVVDDCSTDDTSDLLASIGGIVILRNDTNQGFVRACNRGAQAARGEYLLFLNNDTLVHQEWLDELYAVLSSRMDIGLVGSQLIYANGLLQESGCLICQDGSSIPLGRLEEPFTPEYSYFREVDFCSGASILVRKTDFEAVGGFDSSYAPAYYEDPDLALKLRAIGKKIYVQPLSKVTHFENVSYGEKVYGELTNRNRKIFLDKWSSVLSGQLYASVEDYRMNRRYGRERVLYVDALVPVPDRGAGSIDAYYFMSFLVEEGYDVVFYGQHTPEFVPKYTSMIQRIGVECLYRPYIDFERYLSEHGRSFSYVLVARVYQAEAFDPLIRRYCPNARYIFNTVDVHFLREHRQAEVEGSASLQVQAERTREVELGIMARADATIVISADEKTLLEQHYGLKRIYHIPLIREIYGSKRIFLERRDLVFIGSAHLPNVDGVLYFHREIFPLIRREISEIQLIIIGEELRNTLHDQPGYEALAGDPSVKMVGFVEDLAEYFDKVRVMVAPLRYGSGVKGKIATALSYGVPCVSTAIGIEGMGLKHEYNVLEADGPEDFARQVVRLYKDGMLWERLSENGLAFMSQEYSLEMGKKRLLEVFALASCNGNFEVGPPIAIKRLASYEDYCMHKLESEAEIEQRWRIETEIIPSTQRNFSIDAYCALCRQKKRMSVTFDYAFQRDANGNLIPNWREQLVCECCGLNNRLRASMHLFRDLLMPRKTARIYLTEHVTNLAAWMRAYYLNLSTSEYLGTQVPFGTYNASGIRNESLIALTYKSDSFDFVLSFDVFEHISDYRKAFSECARVLKAGGSLFFSVPFRPDFIEHQIRAEENSDGSIRHYMEPEYHGNPIDQSGGSLCFRVFGWQMLDELKEAGFEETLAYAYWSREYGYLGGEQMLFVARKASV